MAVLIDVPCFDLTNAEKELQDYKNWLHSNKNFSERSVVETLKTYTSLHPVMGLYAGNSWPSKQKFELEIAGVFRADYIAGSPSKQRFVFVEFEGGESNSIFARKKTNQMRDWGAGIQHGLSQISDWSWAKNENQLSGTFKNVFDCDFFMKHTFWFAAGGMIFRVLSILACSGATIRRPLLARRCYFRPMMTYSIIFKAR